MQSRRVVVTGVGTVNPIGRNVPEFLESLDKGVSGAKLITRFDASLFKTRFACEISDFDLQSYGFNRKEGAKIDRYSQFALAAAREAVADAIDDWSRIDKDRVGVIVGSGVGGLESFANETRGCIVGETPRYSPFIIPKILTNMASGHISIHYGFRGPNFAVTSACSTSASAICSAAMIIQTGRADMVVAGGSEAPIEHSGVGGFGAMRAISVNNEEYQTASRPFDKTRDGFVMAEGAG
ncbi:MAG: 3-oxoacyl-ACP synthase, partial [Bacteroidales bacterium]|nr:3-oxoacyl-ACP synthase [Bacteroidales bacterium]